MNSTAMSTHIIIVVTGLARWRLIRIYFLWCESETYIELSAPSASESSVCYYYAYTVDRSRTRSQKIHSTRAQAQRYSPTTSLRSTSTSGDRNFDVCGSEFNFSNIISQK